MTVKELIGFLRTLDQKKEVLVAVNVDYAGMPCWDCREIFNVDDNGREILIKGKINAYGKTEKSNNSNPNGNGDVA